MRGHHISQLLRLKVARHAHEQLVESEVATGVDDGAGAVVHNQELIGLNGLTVLFDEVGKHQAGMGFIAIELYGHGRQFVKGQCACTLGLNPRWHVDMYQASGPALNWRGDSRKVGLILFWCGWRWQFCGRRRLRCAGARGNAQRFRQSGAILGRWLYGKIERAALSAGR